MTIIKQGVLPADRMCRGTCSICQAEVEFGLGEATYAGDDPRGEDCAYIRCPTPGCGSRLYGSRPPLSNNTP